jgi:hypothetical protein
MQLLKILCWQFTRNILTLLRIMGVVELSDHLTTAARFENAA